MTKYVDSGSSQVGPFHGEGLMEETASCCKVSWKHPDKLNPSLDVNMNDELQTSALVYDLLFSKHQFFLHEVSKNKCHSM